MQYKFTFTILYLHLQLRPVNERAHFHMAQKTLALIDFFKPSIPDIYLHQYNYMPNQA